VEERPDEYPEELWDLVSLEDQVKVASEFLRFPDQRLKQCIDDLYYKLAVHVDRRPVETHLWLRRSMQVDKKGDELNRSRERPRRRPKSWTWWGWQLQHVKLARRGRSGIA
jgi:hypothetical protein